MASGRWYELSLAEQLANIGSEVSRARHWQGKDEKTFQGAVRRTLELFYLTIADPRWGQDARASRKAGAPVSGRLKELTRLREVFCDAISGGKEYKSSLEDLDRYFYYFALAARAKR